MWRGGACPRPPLGRRPRMPWSTPRRQSRTCLTGRGWVRRPVPMTAIEHQTSPSIGVFSVIVKSSLKPSFEALVPMTAEWHDDRAAGVPDRQEVHLLHRGLGGPGEGQLAAVRHLPPRRAPQQVQHVSCLLYWVVVTSVWGNFRSVGGWWCDRHALIPSQKLFLYSCTVPHITCD